MSIYTLFSFDQHTWFMFLNLVLLLWSLRLEALSILLLVIFTITVILHLLLTHSNLRRLLFHFHCCCCYYYKIQYAYSQIIHIFPC